MKKCLSALLLLNAILGMNAWSKDLSSRYLEEKNKSQVSVQVGEFKPFKVLIVPGVLAESFISESDNQIKLKVFFEEGFREQIEFLEDTKIDFEFLKLETENSPVQNAQSIISAILNSTKPVLIYSHSKGGLDTLEAFRQRPDLLDKVHGWVSVQSPFWGAAVASGFDDNFVLRDSAKNLFKWMGGSAAGMKSLTINERMTYMQSSETTDLIKTIRQKIQMINYASIKKNTFGIDTPLELFRNFTNKKQGPNDGVVALSSALMKEHGHEIDFIIESDVDHLMTMTRYRLDRVDYNQRAHTLALLKLLL